MTGTTGMMGRRAFLGGAAALSGMTGANLLTPGAARAATGPKRFRFAASGAAWGDDIETAIKTVSRLRLPGLEPFRSSVVEYLDKPLVLRKMFDDAGVAMVSCSGGGPNFMTNFWDKTKTAQSVKDHVAFVRDFIRMFGYCDHFKTNMGGRPPGWNVSDDHIKICADAFNEIGRQTRDMGIRFAPHPHVASLIEMEHEIRTLMSLTDPNYVWITIDTSHFTLGGMDPYQAIVEYWPRVAEIHYKDAPKHLRGNKVLATPRTGPEAGGHGWFRNLGGKDSGGVDFPRIQQFLIDRNYNGWITLDLDVSMMEGKDMEETLKLNMKYLRDVLHVEPATL